MQKKHRFHFPIGVRTVKTAAAVIIAMILVDAYGSSDYKLIFATLGAMSAVQLTFKKSVESCLTQLVGVFCGSVIGIFLASLEIHYLAATAIGVVTLITVYNLLHLKFAPIMPSLIIVILCSVPGVEPLSYGIGRFWDTTIGLAVGMIINTLVFPYDNHKQIQYSMESLDREVLYFLEDLFDGDDHLPDTKKMMRKIGRLDEQLQIHAEKLSIGHLKLHREEVNDLWAYEDKVRQLIAYMKVLGRMDYPGPLNEENRARLQKNGAAIGDKRVFDPETASEKDIVTNYSVSQILDLRRELLDELQADH
ncbi:MAG: hypothetical protein E7223_05660 [Clostridiales bacterium]|nr:hypothetical protein [Clostridiales bacterium]